MSWTVIAAAEVLQEFTPQEQTAIEAIKGSTTQLAAILLRAVNEWRGAISVHQTLDTTAGTIPADVRPAVIASARWRWLISMPAMKALQTKERAEAAQEAADLLQAIREGQAVESATDSTATVGPSIHCRPRKMKLRDQEGL